MNKADRPRPPRIDPNPMIWANRIPMTSVSWKLVPNAPRIDLGDISAKYIGQIDVPMPLLIPKQDMSQT